MSDPFFLTLLKRATYASTGTLIARASAAIAGLIIARSVGPSSFGVYAAVWALILLSLAFSKIGLTMGLKKDGSRHPHRLPSILGNSLVARAAIGLCALLIAYCFLSVVTSSDKAAILFLPLALAGFSIICSEPIFASLQVKGRQKFVSFFMIGRGVTFLIGISILAVFKFHIVALAWFQGILYAVTFLILVFTVAHNISIEFDFSKVFFQIKSSLVFGISELLFSIYSQMPILFLAHFRPEEEVGYFAVAYRFVSLAFLFGASASYEAFLPSLFGLFKSSREKFQNVSESMQKLYFPLGVLLSSSLYVCSEAIIIILQGAAYRPAVGIVRVLCWILIIMYIEIPASAVLTAGDKMWKKIFFQTIVTSFTFLSGLYLIKHYGSLGACYVIIILWLGITILYVSYAHGQRLIALAGYKNSYIQICLTILLSIIIVRFIPNLSLVIPVIFLIFSFLIWRKVLIKILRKYRLSMDPKLI